MKKIIVILLIFQLNHIQSQTLSIDETIDYINSNLKENTVGENYYNLKILNNLLTFDWQNKQGKPFVGFTKYRMNFNEVQIFREGCLSSPCVSIGCIGTTDYFDSYSSGCIIEASPMGERITGNLSFSIFGQKNSDRLANALQYLLNKLKKSEIYNSEDFENDPFATKGYNGKSYVTSSNNKTIVKLETFNGVYKLWVTIGDVSKRFVLDSGASDISLSEITEKELLSKGIIKPEYYIEPALYKLADGSVKESRRLILPELSIGDFRVNNVTASIGVSESPLLLGRSFLDNFRKWSIDNSSKELVLEK